MIYKFIQKKHFPLQYSLRGKKKEKKSEKIIPKIYANYDFYAVKNTFSYNEYNI